MSLSDYYGSPTMEDVKLRPPRGVKWGKVFRRFRIVFSKLKLRALIIIIPVLSVGKNGNIRGTRVIPRDVNHSTRNVGMTKQIRQRKFLFFNFLNVSA